jgi:hypothetical protein
LYPEFWAESFGRAGGWSRSLDGRHNRYSYITVSAIMGFGGEAMGLKPPQSQLRIPWWYTPCSPEAASELEAETEAKFQM